MFTASNNVEFVTVLLARSCSIVKQDVKSFKLKLTNKESPCLTLEMDLVSERDDKQKIIVFSRVLADGGRDAE